MHGGTQRQDDVVDVFRDPDFVTGFHVGRNGGTGALGTEGSDRRFQDVAPEGFDPPAAPCIVGVPGEENDGIHNAHGVVDSHGPAVVTDQLGTVFSHQVGEVGTQADGGQLHDHVHQFHDDVVQVGHEFPHRGFCPAAHAHGDPHGNGCHNVGQHVLPAE